MASREFEQRSFDPTDPDNVLDEIVWHVFRINPSAKLPERAKENAGYDMFCIGEHVLNPGDTIKIPTGIGGAFPENYVALVYDRSSMGAGGVPHFAGVIDSSYRGEIMVVLCNLSKKMVTFKHGDKICQIILHWVPPSRVEEVTDPELWQHMVRESKRGVAGFGSTGGSVVAETESEKHNKEASLHKVQGGVPASSIETAIEEGYTPRVDEWKPK